MTTPRFDFKMYAAALAYYGLPANYTRTFKQKVFIDTATGEPLLDQKTGKPKTTLSSCKVPKESAAGNAVWVQVNHVFDGAACQTNSNGYTYPKKARNEDIQWIATITLDFEYPPDPERSHQIAQALLDYLIRQGLAEPGTPSEDTGAGDHIGLPLPPIETTKETTKLWNDAVYEVVKQHIQPEFDRLVAQAGIKMDLCGFDISRVLSLPGTWRPYRPDKQDCELLKDGYLRKWHAPYIDGNYPERKECAKLAQLIREAYARLQTEAAKPKPVVTRAPLFRNGADPQQWITAYASQRPNTDRSALFHSLVAATYKKYGESTVLDLQNTINDLSGNKYNGRLEQEIQRSLEVVRADELVIKEEQTQLPQVIISGQLRDVRKQALQALRLFEAEAPGLFLQYGKIKRICRDEQRRPLIIDVGEREMRNALTVSADYYRIKKERDESLTFIDVAPPKEIVQSILGLKPDELPFPPIEAIIQLPTLRKDGTIIDAPGYDQDSYLYYMPQDKLEIPAIPAHPTQDDAIAAMEYVSDFIRDFPFEGEPDRANALGGMLTLVTRQMFRHVPLELIDAVKQGTGKGLLTDVNIVIATGGSASALSPTNSDEELDKRLSSLLLEGETTIIIDNVEGVLRSPILAKILTSDYHKTRPLGQSKTVNAANRAIWIATGNNIQVGGDIARRCYRVRMVTPVSNPAARDDFKYPDLLKTVKEQRGEIISKLLTIARAWLTNGRPSPEKRIRKIGTFSEWAETVGGMLAYAGVNGFLENIDALNKDADIDGAAWTLFLETWQKNLGDQEYKTAELIECLNSDKILAETLPEPLGSMYAKEDKSLSRKIGRVLARQNGTPYGPRNLRLVKGEDTHSKVANFKVVSFCKTEAQPDIQNFEKSYPADSQENYAQKAGFAGYEGYENARNLAENENEKKEKNLFFRTTK